tara:strand:- start:2587 stop:3021 length:435 start_codon:yes stop_codon:yes gene_type:complete
MMDKEQDMMRAKIYLGMPPRTRNKMKRNKLSASDVIDIILADISKSHRVTVEGVKGKARPREIASARQQFCWLIRKAYGTQISLKRIGSFIGNRDHSTVLHSIKIVGDLMDTDKLYKQTFFKLLTNLKENYYLRDALKDITIEL